MPGGVWYRAQGMPEAARSAAGRAERTAHSCGDAVARAASHRSMALLAAHDGDRHARQTHYRAALELAPADDNLLRIVMGLNRACHALAHGAPAAAVHEIEEVLRLARDAAGISFEPFGLSVSAAAKTRLGRLEEAPTDAAASQRLRHAVGVHFDAAFGGGADAQPDPRLGVNSQAAEVVREPVGPGIQLPVGQFSLAVAQRGGVRRAVDPLLEQVRHRARAGVDMGGVVPFEDDTPPFRPVQQRQVRQVLVGRMPELLQQNRQVPGHALDVVALVAPSSSPPGSRSRRCAASASTSSRRARWRVGRGGGMRDCGNATAARAGWAQRRTPLP